MPISIRKLYLYIFVAYAATVAFIPKISIEFVAPSGLYIYEPLAIVAILFLFVRGNISFRTNIEKTYFALSVLTFLQYFLGYFLTFEIDTKSFLIIIKYASFIMLMPVAYYVGPRLSDKHLRIVLYSQFLFVALSGAYVAYNMGANAVPLLQLIGSYAPEYRAIGFTGHAVTLDGEVLRIGNTSVQMGVYIAFLTLLCFSFFLHGRGAWWLAVALGLVWVELVTYSRSGLLTLTIGLGYLVLDNVRRRRGLALIALFVAAGLAAISFLDVAQFAATFGTLAKVLRASSLAEAAPTRIYYWTVAWDFLQEHPLALLFGSGTGDAFTLRLTGVTPHFESLVLTTFVQSGIVGLVLLLFHFFFIWHHAARVSSAAGNSMAGAVLYGYKIYVPGLLAACTVGGNALQTDFIAPMFYFLLGACLYRADAEKRIPEGTRGRRARAVVAGAKQEARPA